MAKKVVATLKKDGGSNMYTRVIKAIKSDKSGAYVFEEKMVNKDVAADFFKN